MVSLKHVASTEDLSEILTGKIVETGCITVTSEELLVITSDELATAEEGVTELELAETTCASLDEEPALRAQTH